MGRGYFPGILGDGLSLKISSYPITAQYLAKRLQGKGKVICELCCGIGISLIELSKTFPKVIGVDNDQEVLMACESNLLRASVKNSQLIYGDIKNEAVLENINADIVLYDITFWSKHNNRARTGLNPNLEELVRNIRNNISGSIVIYAPPYMTYKDIFSRVGECEFLEININGRHDRNFIFLGDLIERKGVQAIGLYN